MKALYALLAILLISHYKSEKCNSQTIPSKVKDCLDRDLEKGGYKCCMMNIEIKEGVEGNNKTYCVSLKKSEYEDIVKYMKDVVNNNGGNETIKDAKINCGSSYIFVSILSLILLFV